MRPVFPIAEEKWIIWLAPDGMTLIGKRKFPKQGNIYQLFLDLVSLPRLIEYRNFSLEVLLKREEEILFDDGWGSCRHKGWSIFDHRLIEVVSLHLFRMPADFLRLVPRNLSEAFSTRDLASGIGQPNWLGQKTAYCLRNMDLIPMIGKKGNAIFYAIADKTRAR